MRNLFLRLISLFTIANLLFYSVYPAVNYASAAFTGDDFVDEGGGDDSGSSDEGSSDDSGGGGGGENEGGGGETGSDWDAYSEETPEAATQDPEIPQESFDFAQDQQPFDFAQDQQPSVSTQGGPIRAPGLSYILPPDQETPAAEALAAEQQQQAAYYDDLLTSEEQDQLTNWAREDYKEQISQEPVVDDQSQNDALSAYSQSAAEAADREDQEWARERGLPDADAQSVIHTLVSTLEKGQDVPDEWWQDYGSKLGDLSDGVVDTITSQVREAQERGEQAKAKQETEALIAAQEREEQQAREALDRFQHGNARERAEEIRQAYGLPEGTDPEQVLSFYNKAMTVGGVEFRSGPQASTVGPYGVKLNSDLSSFIITERSKSTSEYLDAATPDLVGIVQGAIETGKDLYELYQSMPPGKAVEVYFSLTPEARDKVNQAMLNGTKEIAGAAVQMVPFVGTNIMSERVNGLNSNMAQIAEKLKDPNLTEEEREELKQEYFSSLNEIQDVKRDLVVNAAFDLVGGVPGSVLAQKAAGKGATAARTLFVDTKAALQAAKQAGKGGFMGKTENVFLGGITRNIEENLVEGRSVSVVEDIAQGVTDVDKVTPEVIERAANVAEQIGTKGGDAELITIDLVAKGVPEERLVEKASTADRFIDYLNSNGGVVSKDAPKEIRDIENALKYDSNILADRPLDLANLTERTTADLRANIIDSLIRHEDALQKLEPELQEARRGMELLRDHVISKGGADPSAIRAIDEIFDPERIHIVDPEKFVEPVGGRFVTIGLYRGELDKQILLHPDLGTYTQNIMHECAHGMCDLANPDYVTQLSKQLGEKPAILLIEASTELTAEMATELVRGYKPAPNFASHYEKLVERMVEISREMVKNGVADMETAYAEIAAAQLTGNFDGVIQKTGGVEKIVDFLTKTPLERRAVDFRAAQKIPTNYEKAVAIGSVVGAGLLASSVGNVPDNPQNKQLPWNFILKEVLAKDNQQEQSTIVNSNYFEYLVKKELAKRTLRGVGKINDKYVKELLETDVFTSQVQKTSKGFVVTTGKNGTAQTEADSGQYVVNTNLSPDLDIKAPSFVEVKAGTTIVPIGIKEGSGKVEKISAIRSRGGIEVYAQDQEELPKVKVAAFYDENGNGNWDGNEKALPWAGIQVSLTKVNQEKTVSMLPGWNLITLTALPTTPLTAASLLGQIAKQGGYATTVSKLENGAWKSYVIRGNDSFSGEDFPIEPGQAYFVKNLKRALLAFEGQEFAQPVKVNLADGWNAVGFPKTAGDYTVSTLIDELNTQEAGADAAARWESGLWDSFVKVGESYGENFAIEPNRGYIVRLKKGVELIP